MGPETRLRQGFTDDATTDLTGPQIVKGQTYEEILVWVKQASEDLLDEAIENAASHSCDKKVLQEI